MRARRSPTAVHLLLLVLAVVGVGVGGAIGVGGAAPAAASTPVTPQIVTGSEHTCALSADGTVRCWGRNAFGQLGDGTLTSRSNPVPVVGLSGVTRLSGRSTHTCALFGDGTVGVAVGVAGMAGATAAAGLLALLLATRVRPRRVDRS